MMKKLDMTRLTICHAYRDGVRFNCTCNAKISTASLQNVKIPQSSNASNGHTFSWQKEIFSITNINDILNNNL